MEECGLSLEEVSRWMRVSHNAPYVLIEVRQEDVARWAVALGVPFRRCYIPDALIDQRAADLAVSRLQVVEAALPDPGSVMAGDFGEILVYFYLGAKALPQVSAGTRKWQLKEARTKAAPFTDVLRFLLPTWPQSSADDAIVCAEVKTRSQGTAEQSIPAAIQGATKDRASRLANTLVWLRDRAILHGVENVSLDQIERFIKATEHPEARKDFFAVVVVSAHLLADALADAPNEPNPDYTVVVIAVPELYDCYTAVFDSMRASVA